GYASDERVTVARARTDAAGLAKFTGLDASGGVAYFAFALLPRGRSFDRLATDMFVLGGVGGHRAMLVGPARGTAAPVDDPDDLRARPAAKVPAGKVRVEVDGVLDGASRVELYDAATRKRLDAGDAPEATKQITFDFTPRPGQVLYAEATGAHALRGRSTPFQVLGDRGAATMVSVYPRIVPRLSIAATAFDDALSARMMLEVSNNSWVPYAGKLVLPLPRGARDPELDEDARGVAKLTPAGFEILRPLPPGGFTFTVGFDLPGTRGEVAWSLALPEGAFESVFSVGKEPGVALENLPAGARPSEHTARSGRAYLVADHISVARGKTMELTVKLPKPGPDAVLQRACRKLGPDLASPLLGKPAPDFALAPITGGPPVKLSSLRGKTTLVNFMASWDALSGDERPRLAALAKELGASLSIVLLASDRDPALVARVIGPQPFPVLLDAPKKHDDNIGAVTSSWGIKLLPESYLVDRKGVVRLYLSNARHWDTPEALACVKALVAGP
ncbi:MAG: TlpA family protein disulfide reductase, partial [Deltaproteobacteria bacterium]|nr:TlpA family protein disulfide reductase [Deltaproteobacteria bacterium]